MSSCSWSADLSFGLLRACAGLSTFVRGPSGLSPYFQKVWDLNSHKSWAVGASRKSLQPLWEDAGSQMEAPTAGHPYGGDAAGQQVKGESLPGARYPEAVRSPRRKAKMHMRKDKKATTKGCPGKWHSARCSSCGTFFSESTSCGPRFCFFRVKGRDTQEWRRQACVPSSSREPPPRTAN